MLQRLAGVAAALALQYGATHSGLLGVCWYPLHVLLAPPAQAMDCQDLHPIPPVRTKVNVAAIG